MRVALCIHPHRLAVSQRNLLISLFHALSADENQPDIALEHIKRLCTRDELSTSEEAQNTGNAQHGAELGGIFYRPDPLTALKSLFKALHVQYTDLVNDGNQFPFSEFRVVLAFFPGLLKWCTEEFPELTLNCHNMFGLNVLGSLLAVGGHVVPLQSDQTLINILFHEARLGFVHELHVERAFEA